MRPPGQHRSGGHPRHRSVRIVRSTRRAVAEGVQVGGAVQPVVLEAGHLGDRQAGRGRAEVEQRLDLEAVAPDGALAGGVGDEAEDREVPGPEGVVAVAEVREAGAEHRVDDHAERPVAEPAQRGDVAAARSGGEPRALREVGARGQRRDEPRDLGRVGRAVGVDHHDDVASHGGETAGERVALALPRLRDQADAGQQLAGHFRRAVDRMPVDHDDLVQPGRQGSEDMLEVACLVERRDDYGDTLPRDLLERWRGNGGHDVGPSGDRHAVTLAGQGGQGVCLFGA